MAEIRLNKLTRQFNVGLQTLVDFLNGKGANVEMNPNAKVSDEYIPDLEKAFGGDAKAKEDSERVQIKIKEIIEKGTKKKEDDEEEPASGTVIIRGAGNGSFAKAEEAEAPAEEVKAEPEVKPEEEAAPAKGIEPEVVPEQKPEPTPEPGPVQEPEPVMKEEIKVEEKPVIEEKPVAEPEPAAHVAATLAVTEEKPEKPSVPTPAEEAHSGQAKKSDLKKSDRAPKEFNPKVDKAKLKAEHKLQKAASSSDEEETTASTGGLKIVGKVDLSQFEPKKNKKRERIAKGGSQKVDVNKIDNDDNRKDGNKKNRQGGNNGQNGKKDFRQGGNNGGQQQGGGKNRRKDRNNDRFKPAMTEAEQEEMQKEIQKQVKETYARMNDSKSKNNFGAKHRKEKRELASQKLQEEMAQEAA